ncbi:hypothetical protein [Actinosynnema sp. NPDC020468]|uniref:hypothetical protein n=1 Tax=Actinosynnema sp. NPDC020468 TaxID=3154488 RepID=UPI00340C4A77
MTTRTPPPLDGVGSAANPVPLKDVRWRVTNPGPAVRHRRAAGLLPSGGAGFRSSAANSLQHQDFVPHGAAKSGPPIRFPARPPGVAARPAGGGS